MNEAVLAAKEALRSGDSPVLVELRARHLDQPLGEQGWLDAEDVSLESLLTAWGATDADWATLQLAAEQSSIDGGQGLADCIDNLAARAASIGPGEDEWGARYTNITPLEGYSGWWSGWDTTTNDWAYIKSSQQPDDDTPGWAAQPDTDSQADWSQSQSPASSARYTNITPLEGYSGWWSGWDTTTNDWAYINSSQQPDDDTPGWLDDQQTAFYQMSQAAGPTADPQASHEAATPGSQAPAPAAEPNDQSGDDAAHFALPKDADSERVADVLMTALDGLIDDPEIDNTMLTTEFFSALLTEVIASSDQPTAGFTQSEDAR